MAISGLHINERLPRDCYSHHMIPAKLQDVDTRCGYGRIKWKWLQIFNKMPFFVLWVFILCFLEGFAVNGIGSAALPSLERQFQLTSTKSALIPSSQDIGALIVVLFVSFIGGKYHKPFLVATGSLIMAIGSFLFIIPHLAESYRYGDIPAPASTICSDGGASGSGGPPPSCESEGEKYLSVFMLAQIMHGIGFTPMFTLGTVYIDENEDNVVAAVYIGLTYAAAAIGVAAGFFAGGQISEKLFVDFDRVDQESLGFDARDPRWIGAWWYGFVYTAVGFCLVAIPIYGYPKQMPGYVTSAGQEKEGRKSVFGYVKEMFILLFKSLLQLVKNPIYMFITLAGCSNSLIISGVSAFSFKFLAEQYMLNFDTAGFLIGGLILTGAVGMFMGGVLVRIFRLEVVGMTRLCILVGLTSAVLGIGYLAGCPNVKLVGLEVAYPGKSTKDGYADTCQGNCSCESQGFSPVCGHDNNVYFSACHAGCTTQTSAGKTTNFGNCSCIADRFSVDVSHENATATQGRCENDCTNIRIIAPCMYIALLAILLSVTPTSMVTLRCVEKNQKPFAIGLQWLLLRLLGMIPGPVLVGSVLDSTCEVWMEGPCGSKFCMMYNLEQMSTSLMTYWIIICACSSVFSFIASLFAVRRRNSSD